ncbi:MAG TPA: nucleoside hydrolase [Gemmatimonadales bacterium]|nr:nucleoside hydrolase [Gemmatimonadales bacterium]
MARALRWAGVAAVVLAALLVLTTALPVRRWRTGQMPVPPLPLMPGGPEVDLPRRIWIDTDAACGHARTADPDDCLAILLLARTPDVELVGISTVFGNAPLDVTDRTTRELAALLRGEGVDVPVYRGAARPLDPRAAPGDRGSSAPETPAQTALGHALAEGPLTILSLGPLTNVELTLRRHAAGAAGVGRLVAVMGRRPGHIFHPTEGRGAGAVLFGHGPVFRDLNLAEDPSAAAALLARRLPMTLVPYEVAREVSVGAADLDRMTAAGGADAWVARRSREWLEFWRKDVGLAGFYPFDAVAAAYVDAPELFSCARVAASVETDAALGWVGRLLGRATGLLVRPLAASAPPVGGRVVYCPQVADSAVHHLMLQRLAPAS